MTRILVIVALACLVCSSVALKKDKFKIKAKGFGLKNLQAPPPAAPVQAPPAPQQPYYPPQQTYYPPPAPPAAPTSSYYGNGASAAQMMASNSANMMSSQVQSASPHVVPIIVPIALMTSSHVDQMRHSLPQTQSLPLMASSLGSLNTQASSFAYNMPKVDMEYAQYPYTSGGSYGGYSGSSGSSGISNNFAGFAAVPNSNFDEFDGFSSDSTGFSRSSYGRRR